MAKLVEQLVEDKEEGLEILVSRYGRLKSEMDSYKKSVEADNAKIKELMSKSKLKEFESEGFIAKYRVDVSNGFDNEKLVSKLQKMDFNGKSADEVGLITYTPVVDMSVLENLIYTKQLDAATLADCRTTKETPKLTITKVKGA